MAAFTALAGKGQGSPGQVERVLQPAGEDVRFAQANQEERLVKAETHSLDGAQRVLEQRDAISHLSGEHVGIAEDPRVLG